MLTANAQRIMTIEQFDGLSLAQRGLYLRVKKADSLSEVRIKNYLLDNKQEKRFVMEKGRTLVITDVHNGTPIYTSLDNANAAIATGTNHLQVGGSLGLDLDGSGIMVGVWDGGPIQTTHTEFQNSDATASRVINIEGLNTEGTAELDNHGTHVTGTISARGVNPNAKGMATAVNIRTYNFLNDALEMVTAVSNVSNPMFLSNHSYGLPINQSGGQQLDAWRIGGYTGDAREIDDIARTYPNYLIVASAGNGGLDSYPGSLAPGFDKLTGDKNAKNNLVVANAAPTIDPFTSEITFIINPSSSQGPTDDLRIKPDIAGDGTGLTSTLPGDAYGSLTGTSMSAPNVTGSLVLLQQYYSQLHGQYMKASTLKGLVCHTATDDTDRIGPDAKFGWGLLNSKKAAEVISGQNENLAIIDELTLLNGATYTREFTVGSQNGDGLSATICWTDVPGPTATVEDENNTNVKRLVNDLDIKLIKDGEIFMPWKLDYIGSGFVNSKGDNIADNIERVDIEAPEPGIYQLIVSHKGTIQTSDAFDPLEQDFSLILTGDNVTLDKNSFTLDETLMLYPNPNNGDFIIKMNSKNNVANNVKIKIYDVSGRSVYDIEFNEVSGFFKENIEVKNLKPGVYIVNISQGSSSSSRKMLIQD